MTSEEERIEVAESIRYYAKESDESAYEFIRGYLPNDLADLIDPTCEREDDDTDEDSQYRGTSLCSECGELLISQFRYCPHCGARVTSGGEG